MIQWQKLEVMTWLNVVIEKSESMTVSRFHLYRLYRHGFLHGPGRTPFRGSFSFACYAGAPFWCLSVPNHTGMQQQVQGEQVQVFMYQEIQDELFFVNTVSVSFFLKKYTYSFDHLIETRI